VSDPTIYVPSYSFSGWQATNPSKPLPAAQVDNELANISTSFSQTITALEDIRRSDGQLQNGIVTVDSLSPGLTLGFVLKGGWTLGAHYTVGDGVFYGGKCYRCQVVNDATNANRPDVDAVTWLFLYSTTDLAGAMSIATYDPTGIGANVFARANHTGTQAQSTIVNLVADLAAKADAAATTAALALKQAAADLSFGQCQLTLSGGNLLLSRYNGRLLTINGVHQIIPASGPTLAATGLTPATLYYIYAWMNAGTMTLEASTTVPVVDAATGVWIKTGDATRTRVGVARPITGPAWTDTPKQRFVRSWYNDPGVILFNNFTASRTTTSTSYVEINSEIRCEALIWSGEAFEANASGTVLNSAASGRNQSSLAYNGTTPEIGGSLVIATTANDNVPFTAQALKTGLTEGYNYVTLLGLVSSGTGTWLSDSDGRRTTLLGRIRRT
jgi:hypothetical protein